MDVDGDFLGCFSPFLLLVRGVDVDGDLLGCSPLFLLLVRGVDVDGDLLGCFSPSVYCWSVVWM